MGMNPRAPLRQGHGEGLHSAGFSPVRQDHESSSNRTTQRTLSLF